MDEQRQWHRLFGMSWTDFFVGRPATVEMEKDLSLKQQLLDVVIVRTDPATPLTFRLPDGFDNLGPHNLISFKSYQEALSGRALNELISHFVNYHKQASPSMDDLLPEDQFRLYAVSVRFPRDLARHVPFQPLQQGVYEVRHFTGTLRVVVIHELPEEEQNAMLLLFSAKPDLVRYGTQHYRPRSQETSTFLNQLFQRYQQEGVPMPFTKEQFVQEAIEQILKDLPPEKRLEGLSPEKRLEGLSPEQRLAGLSPEDLIKGLPPETLEALLRRVKGTDGASNPS